MPAGRMRGAPDARPKAPSRGGGYELRSGCGSAAAAGIIKTNRFTLTINENYHIGGCGRMPVLDGLGTADYDNYDHDYRDYDRGG
mgnify:CR=1 FL=1